jgi:hypothetical protein
MGGKVLGVSFGSCGDNRRVFEMDKLCGSENCCFGRVDSLWGEKIGKDGEVGKCQRCILGKISLLTGVPVLFGKRLRHRAHCYRERRALGWVIP